MLSRNTEEDEAMHFQDMSTWRGQLGRMVFRWKFPFAALLACFIFFILLDVIAENNSKDAQEPQASPPPEFPQVRIKNGILEIHGDSSKPIVSIANSTHFFQYFDSFPGIQNSISLFASQAGKNRKLWLSSIKSIEIKWYKLDGPNLSKELSQFLNLEVLHLDNVTILNELQPSPLPKLRELYINQLVELGQPEDFQFYVEGPSSYLASAFFFLNDVNNVSNFSSNLAQTKVNISIWLSGSVVFSVDPVKAEIRTEMATCRPLLENSTVQYTKATLSVCNDLLPTSISTKTQSLNLYLINGITSGFLSALWPNLPELEAIFVGLADNQVEISIAELPKSLTLLSAISTRLTGSSDIVLPNLREFYFAGEIQYPWLDVNERNTSFFSNSLLQNFCKVFPNIDKVGVFELTQGRYSFLKGFLDSTATTIVVQGFQRSVLSNATDTATAVLEPDQEEVENLLTELGLPNTATFFEIVQKRGKRTGRILNWDEQISLRYKMLGWDGIDLWDKYVYVRRLIDRTSVLP